MRGLPAARIAALAGTASATSPLVGGPLVDGTIIPKQLIDAFESDDFNQVPMMMGTTRDEGNFTNGIAQYFKPDRGALTDADFRAYLERTYGGNAGPGGGPPAYPKGTVEKVLARYPNPPIDMILPPGKSAGDINSVQFAWDAAHSDVQACRGQYTAAAIAPHAPVYMYVFNDRTAQSYFPKMPGYQPLAYHTSDIAYLFTGYHGGPEGVRFTLTPEQAKLSDKLVDAWANFARTGNPNGKGDAPWPRWKPGNAAPAYFLQDDGWKMVQTNAQFAAAHNCAFWNKILLYK